MDIPSFLSGLTIGVICTVLTVVLWAMANDPNREDDE